MLHHWIHVSEWDFKIRHKAFENLMNSFKIYYLYKVCIALELFNWSHSNHKLGCIVLGLYVISQHVVAYRQSLQEILGSLISLQVADWQPEKREREEKMREDQAGSLRLMNMKWAEGEINHHQGKTKDLTER